MGTNREDGFSLIEVLIVVVIIVLLASIAIPYFVRHRERAWEAQVNQALKDAATAMEAATAGSGEGYTGLTIPQLEEEEGLKFADSVVLEIPSANEFYYCIKAVHENLPDRAIYYDVQQGRPGGPNCSSKYN